ncbi:MAG: K+ channel, inward rectifier [Bacteroidetes bacterium]|nr:MAG: K+ channel, inward rectifier [Bacteroidota bacterium]
MAGIINKKKNEISNDLGLGTRDTGRRGVNKDGSFNVERTGIPKFRYYEIYHDLISMSWKKFILLVLLSYGFVNLLFAGIYYFIGMEHLSGIAENASESERFMEAFFFSSQTLTTLGYGRIAPVGALASSVAAIESMLGLLGFALATGLLYGRFSRPQARILFSHNILVAPYRDHTGLMFRIVNQRSNQLIEVEAEVTLSYQEKGKNARSFAALGLERNRINLFPLSWTVVHPINEESPFYGMSEKDLRETEAEIIILIKAFDDTFSQTVYSRSSYQMSELVWGSKFLPMFSRAESGKTLVDLRLIDAMEKVQLPVNAKVLE